MSNNVNSNAGPEQEQGPLKTMGDLRLYAQGINPVLVKLDQYEATRLQPPFSQMVFAWLQGGDKVHDLVNFMI